MILPTRRWLMGATGLALLAPAALVVPAAVPALVLADLCWIVAWLIDAWRAAALPLETFPVRREAPPAFSVGRRLPVTYRWTNPASRPLRIRVREEVPDLLAFPAADRELLLGVDADHVETHEPLPVRRGRSAGGRLALRLAGPWGLAWRQGSRELPWPVVVYPVLQGAGLRALRTPAQRRREAGERNLRRLGAGRAFESLREWVPGDESRVIDWKATARRGRLMARQYEDERRQQVMLVIDAGRLLTAEYDGRARLEAAVVAALELAAAAAAHDDDVGIMAFADEVLHFSPPGRGVRAVRRVVDALAGLEGRLVEPDYPAAFAQLAVRSRKRAFTVLFTDVIDRTASEAFLAHAATLRPRHLPLAVVLRDPALERLATEPPATEEAAFARAAAEELLEARAAALAELRAQGVLVLDVPPEGAARAVVAQYEQLKRRAAI